jgi:hypothetical protein
VAGLNAAGSGTCTVAYQFDGLQNCADYRSVLTKTIRGGGHVLCTPAVRRFNLFVGVGRMRSLQRPSPVSLRDAVRLANMVVDHIDSVGGGAPVGAAYPSAAMLVARLF